MSDTHGDGSKSGTPRPRTISDDQRAANWNTIFGKDRFDILKERAEQERLEKEKKDGLDLRSGDIS
jgi:hypothetical protein